MKNELEKKNKSKSKAASTLGRAGGKSVAKKRGNKYMSRIGKRGARARWKIDIKSK